MASRSLGTLTLDLIAKIGGYLGPLDKGARGTKKFADDTGKSLKAISKSTALLGTAAATGFGLMVKHSIDVQDELSKTSQKIGVSVEDLSALRFSADLAGVGFQDLSGSLGKFNKNINEAFSSGRGAAADAFADLGIKVTDTAGRLKSTNQLFSEVADRFVGLEDGAVKTSLAMDLFGKAGKDLIPLLNSGASGLKNNADEAQRLGQIFSGESAKAAEAFNDNLSRLQRSIGGMANAVAQDALPELTKLSELFADPKFRSNMAGIGSGLIYLARGALLSVNALANLGKTLGEDLARDIHGISDDDIPALTTRLKELNAQLDPKNIADYLNNSEVGDIFLSEKTLNAERDRIQGLIDAWKKSEQEIYKTRKSIRDIDVFGSGEDPFDSTTWSENIGKITAAQIKANAELRESNKKRSEEAAKLSAELKKRFEETRDALHQEIDLYGKSSEAASTTYQTTVGDLKNLDQAQKDTLISLAKIKDAQVDETERAAGVATIIDALKDEENQLILTADAYLKMQLQAKGATDAEIADALSRAENVRQIKKNIQDIENAQSAYAQYTQQIWSRIDEEGSNAWLNILRGAKSSFDGIKDIFERTLAEMAHQALTKPILLRLQQSIGGVAGIGASTGAAASGSGGSSSSSGAGAGALAGLGVYAVAAVAVVAAVGIWNRKQDEKFVKMTAEYKQGNQSIVKVLGEGNKKSQSINTGIETLKAVNGDVLNVNYSMLSALLDIRAGLGNVAAGFAKTLIGGADYQSLGISQGSTNLSRKQAAVTGLGVPIDFESITRGTGTELDGLVGEFLQSISDSINGAIFKKKKKVIDSGIQIMGSSLADILTGGALQAFSYADVKTSKKVFGISAGSKVNRTREDLDESFENQISGVFENAGEALKLASTALGINFNQYVNDLNIATQDLSLKGLEGDALTKEIESFFGATLDNWADVLLGGTEVLNDFQKVGESAFETMVRLASQTNTFNDYAKTLGLNFDAVGLGAVYAAQYIADLAGGFEGLSSALGDYYSKFFSDSERFLKTQDAISTAFSDLGYALPKTRDEFKKYINQLDLSVVADQEKFASLIKLSSATDSYLTALDAETKAKEEAATASEDATKAAQQSLRDAASSAFDAFSKSINVDIEKVQDALSSSKQIADSLSGALRGMRLESSQADLLSRRQAQAQLFAANAISKAGGPLPQAGALDDALQALAQPSQDLFSNFEDYARDFYLTQKNLKELSDAAGGRVSIEEKNLAALQESLDYYQQEIDLLNGIDNGVLSVRDSIARLAQALVDAGSTTSRKDFALPTLSNDYETKQNSVYAPALNKSASLINAFNAESAAKGVADITVLIKELSENLQASQFAIAKNTLGAHKILSRWDIDGMPEEREPEETLS